MQSFFDIRTYCQLTAKLFVGCKVVNNNNINNNHDNVYGAVIVAQSHCESYLHYNSNTAVTGIRRVYDAVILSLWQSHLSEFTRFRTAPSDPPTFEPSQSTRAASPSE